MGRGGELSQYPSRRGFARHALVAAILAGSASLLVDAPAAAQVVRGIVIEAAAPVPIPAAEVLLVDEDGSQRASALTDESGVFLIRAPEPGSYTLSVRRIGYVAVATPVVEVSTSEAVAVEVRMSQEAILLEPLVVVQRRWYGIARLDRFYERADWNSRLGRGRIYYHDDVKNLGSIRHLLSGMIMSSRGCPMQVLIDGLPVGDIDDIDALAHPSDVEGVEIYRGPSQMPVEFAHLRACALTLIWTRPSQGKPFTWKRFFIVVGAFGLLLVTATN